MRTPARPRLPDGDCVFISDVRIVARADALRHCCRHGATGIRSLSVSKLKKYSSFETERERMTAWVDRATYMERLWALEGAQSRLFIDEVQLREGFEMASNSIRARGGWISGSR